MLSRNLTKLGWLGKANNNPTLPTWTPSALGSDLALWLDADDASTITLNGSNVSQWNDKSGNGRNIGQAVATQQPAYSNAGLNGKNILTFDGTDDILFRDTQLDGLSNVSMFAVMRYISGGATQDLPIGIGTGTAGRVRSFFRTTSGTTQGFAGWSADVASSVYSLDIGGAHHIFSVGNTALSGANNVFIGRDGLSTAYTSGAALGTTFAGFSVGSLQGTQVGAYYSNVSIAEIVVLPKAVSSTEREQIEGYLAWKWGLTYALPANHPYRWDTSLFGGTNLDWFDADAKTYIASVETADVQELELGVKNAINNFIVGAKADGIWDAIKSSAILAGARTLNGALRPLKGTAPTNFNFVAGDYNRKTGLVGNGTTKYLDSNRNNNADSQNNNHNAVYVSTAETSAVAQYIGTGSTNVGRNNLGHNPAVPEGFARNRSTAGTTAAGTPTGLLGHSRNNGSNYIFRASGSNITATESSNTPENANVDVFRRGTGNYTNARIAFYSIGESLNLALLDTRVTQLMTDLNNATP